jgi:NAD(P)-dependent dehydrogenase (short-subunit alcohol dehydrogenase family)
MNTTPAERRSLEAVRSILIAGGTKGIGFTVARRFAAPGRKLFLNYAASDDAARQAAEAVQSRGAEVHLIKQDVATIEGSAKVIDAVAAKTDRLDLLVHCSAVPNPAPLHQQDAEVATYTIAVAGLSLLYLVQPALRLMREGSNVIFLSGKSVDVTLTHFGALATAKAAGECMVRYLAIELAPRGINVNTLRTGPLDTDLSIKARAGMRNPEHKKPAVTPNGRRLELEEVADVVEFLASPAASMIRGQIVSIDGGLCVMSH